MKKRILSILLSVAVAIAMIPSSFAFAADNTVTIDENTFSEDMLNFLCSNGAVQIDNDWTSLERGQTIEVDRITGLDLLFMEGLDFSGIDKLTGINYLLVENEGFDGKIDFGWFPHLKILDVSYCEFTSIDLSKNRELEEVYARKNAFNPLDLSEQFKLNKLDIEEYKTVYLSDVAYDRIKEEAEHMPENWHAVNHDPAKYSTLVGFEPAGIDKDGQKGKYVCECGDEFADEACTVPFEAYEVIPMIKSVKLSSTSLTYTGKTQKPKAVIKDSKGTSLTTSSYTLGTGAKSVGKHTIKVTFKNNYAGSKSLSYKILPKKATVKSVTPGKKKLTVKAGTKVSSTGGSKYRIAYKVKGAKSWKYTTTTSQTKTIKSLKKGKKYQVKIQAYKGDYKGSWSSVKTTGKIK